jgi:transposase
MARPKAADIGEIAERAKADLAAHDRHGVAVKLKAIMSSAQLPVATVAQVMDTTQQTVLRWIAAYREGGVDGLLPRAKRPRRPKLTEGQRAAVLSWLDSERTAAGEPVHWTLDGLRAAIAGEFGVALARSGIWKWLRKEGRKPKVPRPRHHLSDADAQAAFKKKRRG